MEVQAPAVEPVAAPVATEPVVQAPTAPEAPKVEAAPAAKEQYDLPDGTKVDAEGLSKAWRDNFMPDYTRKAQELAAFKAKNEPKAAPEAPKESPWADPQWEPKTYQELATSIAEKSKAEVWQQILDESTRADRESQQRDAYISQEIEQIKGLDPKVNVNAVMAHASKYAFPSLIPAFQNMKAIEDAERRVEERVLKNMKQRAGEPVGTGAADPGAGVTFPPGVRTGYEKARWILNNQK